MQPLQKRHNRVREKRLQVSTPVASWMNFNPLSLTPVVWFDASDSTTITESGGAVSQWDDKSGNGINLTQATAANQPTTGTRTQNGLNVLDFNGDKMDSGYSISQIGASRAFTQFLVLKCDTVNTNQGFFAAQRSGTQDFRSGWAHGRRASDQDNEVVIGNGQSGNYHAYKSTDNKTTAQILVFQTSAANDIIAVYANLTSLTLTSTDGVLATTDFMSAGSGNHAIRLGDRFVTTIPFDGYICEFILYASSLSTVAREQVTNYLNAKWAIF